MLAQAKPGGTKPFLKWAGGKRQLIPQYVPYFPNGFKRYFEPFVGSAAVYFYLQPRHATLSDSNGRLIEVYQVVRDEVDALIDALRGHRNDPDYYYTMRAKNVADLSIVERAARFIYLNKTCYNGLYRVNKKGKFNVPFGRYDNPKICDEQRLCAVSRQLQGVELRIADFSDSVAGAAAGDFVYFDPPYAPLSKTSSFTAYDQSGFGESDQRRLAATVDELTRRGASVMLSNSAAPLVYELYDRSSYRLIPIRARRSINSQVNGRKAIKELLILNNTAR